MLVELFVIFKHSNQLGNSSCTRLGLTRCGNAPDYGVAIGFIKGFEELFSGWIRLECDL